ncbi:MAG: carboxylesterase family protein [Bacteroidales bacterium]|nr:carboxylesterase family protein [Bacteroidales bacterium]
MTLLIPGTSSLAQVKIEGGLIEGNSEGAITSYYKIPYAAPPVGDLRWKAPQPVIPWEGVRKADVLASASFQPRVPWMPELDMSEDCLYLNIWTPAKKPDEKLPVMVWIHGGAFVNGSPTLPSDHGDMLSQKGVVYVNVAYRLGVLGFLAHPELSAESENRVSGNYGLLDQIEALKWVQKNIAAFGGDPENVTIFGESAGAISVATLAASPLTKGLFRRAISQSGGAMLPICKQGNSHDCLASLSAMEDAGLEFTKRMGVSSMEELRALPPEKWLEDSITKSEGSWPVFDGYVIHQDPYTAYQNGDYNDVDILVGINSDEGYYWGFPMDKETYLDYIDTHFGPFSQSVLKLYPAGDEAANFRSTANLFGDMVFAYGTWAWSRLQSQTGKSKVYVYYFDQWKPSAGSQGPAPATGALHAAEVPFVMQHLDPSSDPADLKLSDEVASYWTNFVKTGDPNGEGLAKWPEYKEGKETVMYLKTNPHAGPVPNMAKLLLLEEYYNWKRNPEN